MFVRISAVLFLVLGASLSAFAQDDKAAPQDDKAARIEQIARALNLEQRVQDQQARIEVQGRAQLKQVVAQLRNANAGIPDDYIDELSAQADTIIAKVAKAWDPKVVSRIFAEGLLEAYSADQLTELARYVDTPEWQKAYRTLNATELKVSEYVSKSIGTTYAQEMGGFIEKMKQAAARSKDAAKTK